MMLAQSKSATCSPAHLSLAPTRSIIPLLTDNSMTTMAIFSKIRRRNRKQKNTRAIDTTSLPNLISAKEWGRVDRFLKTSIPVSASSRSISTVATTTDDFIIHDACKYSAPLQIITELSVRFPSSINSVDDHGRYPIHVAVASGCKPDVIGFLIQENAASAGVQDIYGKTPIHYATDSYAMNYNFSVRILNIIYRPFHNLDKMHQNTLSVIELLGKAAPHTLNIEDNNEMNPIEHAVLNYTSARALKAMYLISRKDWKRQKDLARVNQVQSYT